MGLTSLQSHNYIDAALWLAVLYLLAMHIKGPPAKGA